MRAIPREKALRKITGWLGASKLKFVALLVIVVLVIPPSSQGQFIPSPCCAILSAGLSSVANAITNVIGNGLNAINATMTSIEGFHRLVVWPQNLINRAKE